MPNQITVPFHGSKLLIVEHNDQPYTPMKPIAEGMGMSWQGQHQKLKLNPDRWTIKEILMVAEDGKQRPMICLPLRKLFGWLQTISPNKVKASIRDRVIQYQNECDDVLWQYWTNKAQHQPKPQTPAVVPLNLHLPVTWWNQHSHILKHHGCQDYSFTQANRLPVKMLFGDCIDSPSAITSILMVLKKAGYEVEAAEMELQAHRHFAETMYQRLEQINRLSQDVLNSSVALPVRR